MQQQHDDALTQGKANESRFVAGGKSCILISHVLGEVLQNADRIVRMADGRMSEHDGEPAGMQQA